MNEREKFISDFVKAGQAKGASKEVVASKLSSALAEYDASVKPESFGKKAVKFAAKAAPVAGSIIGGIAGTAISPILGSAAGATAGYAGGRVIGEEIENLFGVQDETPIQRVKSMGTEAALTGGTNLALGLAGKYVVQPAIKAVSPGLKSIGKTLSEKVVPAKIKGTSPDFMSQADEVFNIRQKLGLKGSPTSQARQAEVVWNANKKAVETLLKKETASIPKKTISNSIDDAVKNTIGFDETSAIGKKTVQQARSMLANSKNSYDLFKAQQLLGTKAFSGMPTPEKAFLKEVYGNVSNLFENVSPAARAKIAENAAIRKIIPSLKGAIGKEGFSLKEIIGTVAATSAAPTLGTKATALVGGIAASTKPGILAMDKLSRILLGAGVKKEAVKKVLSNQQLIKVLLSPIPAASLNRETTK